MTDLISRLEAEGLNAEVCWEWPGARDKGGRGRLWVGNKLMLAHRAVWEKFNGPIPTGKILCHHCDNPGCVNPRHMYVGTNADNGRDMSVRRRSYFAKNPDRVRAQMRKVGLSNTWARGRGNPKAKLTPEQVAAIKASRARTGLLAQAYQVSRTTIQRIRSGELWQTI